MLRKTKSSIVATRKHEAMEQVINRKPKSFFYKSWSTSNLSSSFAYSAISESHVNFKVRAHLDNNMRCHNFSKWCDFLANFRMFTPKRYIPSWIENDPALSWDLRHTVVLLLSQRINENCLLNLIMLALRSQLLLDL